VSLQQDIANYLAYVQGSHVPPETISSALLYKGAAVGGGSATAGSIYSTVNISGVITLANAAQDLAAASPNRDRIDIQNLDASEVLLIGIGEDATSGRAFEIDPRQSAVIEEGEANQRISILSSKTGLKFVAIARIST
jgi:hypothetical protein